MTKAEKLKKILEYSLRCPDSSWCKKSNMTILLPDYDRKLVEKDIELAEANKESGQMVVYVKIEKLRKSCHQIIIANCQGQTPCSNGPPLFRCRLKNLTTFFT